MSDTTNLDTREKVDILIKQFYGFPTTNENKEWYEETNVEYNNSFNGEYLLIDPIPEQPDFDTNGIVRKASDIGLNNDNFINYKDDDDDKSSASIVDDSTGTVRRFKLLILESTPNTRSSGFAWFKEDSNGNNVLQDTFQFNFKQYKDPSENIINPYLYEVYTEKSQPSNERLPFGKKGGNFSIDLKSGVLFFADFNNFSNGVQTDSKFQINVTDNKPVLTIYKYIGRKGIAKQLSIEESKDDITDPVKNQIVVQSSDDTIHRYDGTNWTPIGGSGNSDISFNDTKPSPIPPDFEENQLFVDTSHNIIFRVEEDDNGNKSFEQISEKILSGTDDPSGNITGYEGQFYIRKLNPALLYYNNGGTQWFQISGSGGGGGANGGTQIDNDQILEQTSEVVSTIQQSQSLETIYIDITGSSKEYTFPPGAIKVIYRFRFNLTWDDVSNRGDTISQYELQISTNDGSSWTDLKTFRLRNSVFSENFATIEHVIEKGSYPNSIKIKLVGKSINTAFKQKIHYSYLPTSVVVKPILELVSLGTKTIQGKALFSKNDKDNLFYTQGNVGIGTDDPETYLHVHNNSDSWSATSKIRLSTDILTDSEMRHSEISYFRGSQADSTASDNYAGLGEGLRFGNGTRTDLCILNKNGNVGIGTTDPQAKLHIAHSTSKSDDVVSLRTEGAIETYAVNADVHLRSKLTSEEAGGTLGLWNGYATNSSNPNKKTIQISGKADEKSYFNNGGNVGIGTDDPSEKLDVSGNINVGKIYLQYDNQINCNFGDNKTLYLNYYAGDVDIAHSGAETKFGGPVTIENITSNALLKISRTDTDGAVSLYFSGNNGWGSITSDKHLSLKAGDDTGNAQSGQLFLHKDGKVGIGTTEPNSTLQVYGGVSIGNVGAAADGNLKVAGSINGANITSTGTISGATITSTGTISGANITSTGTISGANITSTGTISGAITSTGNIRLDGADLDSYSPNGLALQSASNINNRNVKIPAGKLIVGSSGDATYPLEVYGSTVRGDSTTPYLNFGSVGIHLQEDNNWNDPNKLVYAIATGSSGRNIFIKHYGSRNISIWSQYYVACPGIQQVSDERIKINIRDISDNISLQKLRDISCCLYEYKDPLSRDFYTQLGFIAQQVNKHLPLAISFVKDIIPNEMRIIENPQWSKIIDGSNNKFKLTIPDLEDVSGNTKYKFYMSNDVSGNDECEKISSTLEDERKSFIFDQSWNYVYLYGKEVDDFHRINKDKLFALNFSATQEIDRIQQQQLLDISGNKLNIAKNETDIELLKLENSELKTENADLKTELATLKTQMTDVLSRLSQLESN